jgi:hypothetical protein
MKRPSVRQAGSLLLALVTVLAGCGGAADGFSGSRGTVNGKATLAGKPLPAGCQVLFMATRGGFTASGTVGPEGMFTLQYLVPAGLPVGDYVVQLAPPAPAASGTSADPAEMARRLRLSAEGKSDDGAPFPARYTTTATSGLAFTVQPGVNTFDLALTK